MILPGPGTPYPLRVAKPNQSELPTGETVPILYEDRSALDTGLLLFKPSPIHGLGIFTKAPLRQGAHVLEYLGQRISKAESLRRCEANNEYIFALNSEQDLDGKVAWNPARFINHSCDPNCEAQMEDGRIWIVARRDIQPGEEITFNYAYDLEDYRDYPCRCGSPKCVGYMVAEEFFPHVRANSRNDLKVLPSSSFSSSAR